MAFMLDELKPLKLYKGSFYYLLDPKNRLKNSIVYLLTPNRQSSINMMNLEYTKQNKVFFKSYFLEKNLSFVLDSATQESTIINGESYDHNPMILQEMLLPEQDYIHEADMYTHNKEPIRTFFGSVIDEILNEDSKVKTKYGVYSFSPIFKKMLYASRIKTQKEVLIEYEKIKSAVPHIQYTYSNPTMYKGLNVYYDWSYYTESFFKHYPSGYQGERGIDLYSHFIMQYFKHNQFLNLGYNTQTIVIPVDDWIKNIPNPLDFLHSITPISMIARCIRNRPELLKQIFGDKLIVFISEKGFFTFNAMFINQTIDEAKFRSLITGISKTGNMQAEVLSGDSKKSIVIQLADKLEKEGNIKLTNLTGGTRDLSKEELDDMGLLSDPMSSDDEEVQKAALVNKLEQIADKSTDIKDAEKELDNPSDDNEAAWLKDVLLTISSSDGSTTMNAARISRMNQARKDILGKDVNGKTVKQLLEDFKKNEDIPESEIPIDSIDEHWKHIKFSNFNKVYDLKPDIVAMFMHFQNVSHPMNIVKIEYHNTSTSEDYKDTWTCLYEDAETGKRHTMVLDIPRLIGNRFMKLRGNEKVLIGQLMLLPITKTGDDTVQIVSNYNKIFIRRKSPNGLSKSTPIINKLCKALDKYEGKDIKPIPGDNSKVCARYELPMEFVDIASLYAKIQFNDNSYISFNMDELSKIPFDTGYLTKEDAKKSLDILNKTYLGVYVKNGKRVPILNSPLDMYILEVIREHDKSDEFEKIYQSCSVAKRLMYSEASIMSTTIPVAVVLSYNIGLQKLLNKLEVKYEFSEHRPSRDKTYIKFNDGYLIYHDTTSAQNMLLNGLMECDFSEYSIKDINGKDMWLDMLDDFGGRIKADGLDNFYDLMFDPITVEICRKINIPDNYVDGMIYANNLLIDNRYNRHTDITGNRLRTNEVIVGHLYLILSKAFGSYRNMVKRNKGAATFSAKKDAVIDSILNHDQTSSDLSTLTPLLEAEAASKVTFKGLSGMNSDRAFSIDKRTYDKSMLGILGLSTGFASTVGINRQTTIDAGVVNKRGFIKTRKPEELDNTRTFTVMEALSPMAVNHDDPIRTCMAFTQTVQHQMKVRKSMPNLVTTGCDEALPYLTSNKFAYKFEGKRGVVVEVTDDYIITQDLDTKEYDYIDTREVIQKNSDGGFYVTTQLTSLVKKGQKLTNNQIIAYDKECYSSAIGSKDPEKLAYNLGTLAKVAIMDTDLGYEDSCVVDNTISEALTTEFVVQKEISLERNSNVYNMVNIGDTVEEGDSLMVFQNAFDEKEANELLASLSKDNEALSDLGRKPIHAKSTGVIQDIKIYRTCELDVLSPTLQAICKKYEARINKYKNVMRKYKIDKEYILESTGKLAMEGKLKATEGVKIEFYIKVTDKFGIGDKLVFSQALKGVNSFIISPGDEAYTDFRPNEHINAFLTVDGVMARMVSSANSIGLMNKILIELARQCQEDLGIKWRPMQDILTSETK